MEKIKIICTLGPASFSKPILKTLSREKVDIFRINLSHTNTDQIKKKIKYLKQNNIKNICIDTEGAQIRTTHTKKNILLRKIIKLKFIIKIISVMKKIYIYTHILI